jgi:hypothetical protein
MAEMLDEPTTRTLSVTATSFDCAVVRIPDDPKSTGEDEGDETPRPFTPVV